MNEHLKSRQNWIGLVAGLFTVGLLVRLFRISMQAASDFEVYWYAIQAWTSGQSAYEQYSSFYQGLVFKYPPWILPLFLPFAFLSLSVSKWVWTIGQVVAIFYVIFWTRRKLTHRWLAVLVGFMFWWMWLAHTEFGQIMVFCLAFALWICESESLSSASLKNQLKWLFLADLFTAKIFSLFSLLGVWRFYLNWKVIFRGFLILLLSHFVLIVSYPRFLSHSIFQLLGDLYRGWIQAAFSGGAQLGSTIVRGQQNHGLVAAVLRSLNVDATYVQFDIWIAVFMGMIFSLLWGRFSKHLLFEERWAGWLALGVIIHPLAWHHSFVMAYPLCAISLDRAVRTKNKRLIALSFVGASCITLLIPQVIGTEAVIPLEWIGSKSWGVIFSAIALVKAMPKSPNRSNLLQYGRPQSKPI